MMLVAGWQAAQVYAAFGGNWTALFYHDAVPALPQGFEGTYLHPPGGDYDGQYYRYLTRDPIPPFAFRQWMDAPAQRGSRVLVPGLAWALSLGGRAAPDGVYVALIGVFAAMGVYFSGRWLESRGVSGWAGLLFLIVPATVSSIDRMLVDVALCALVAGFMLAAETGNGRLLLACAAAAPLVRETGFALPAALLLTGRRRQGLAAFLPGGLWTGFVVAYYPLAGRSRELGFLPAEWVRRLWNPRHLADPVAERLLRSLDIVALVALAALIVWTVRTARPLGRELQAAAAMVFLVGGMTLGGLNVMSDPYHWGRVQSPWMVWALLQSVASRAVVGGRGGGSDFAHAAGVFDEAPAGCNLPIASKDCGGIRRNYIDSLL